MGLESVESRYLDGKPVMNCGQETSGEIDKEVMKILSECYDEAEKIIKDNMDALESIGEYLFEHETISGKQFMKLYREVKGIPEPVDAQEESKEVDSDAKTKKVRKPRAKKKDVENKENSKEEKPKSKRGKKSK